MPSVRFKKTTVIHNKIVSVDKNYAAHVREIDSVPSDQMTVFMKPNVCIGDQPVSYRGEQIQFKGEICLLKQGGAVAGVDVGFDFIKRAIQERLNNAGLPWERANF